MCSLVSLIKSNHFLRDKKIDKFALLGDACTLQYVLKRCADFINMKDVSHKYCISVLYQSASNMQKQNIKMNIY